MLQVSSRSGAADCELLHAVSLLVEMVVHVYVPETRSGGISTCTLADRLVTVTPGAAEAAAAAAATAARTVPLRVGWRRSFHASTVRACTASEADSSSQYSPSPLNTYCRPSSVRTCGSPHVNADRHTQHLRLTDSLSHYNIRPHRMHALHTCGLLLPMFRGLCVCRCVDTSASRTETNER